MRKLMRIPRFLICVRRSGDGERDVEVCPSEEQAGDEAGVEHVGHVIYAETVLEWETCLFIRTLPVRLSNGM